MEILRTKRQTKVDFCGFFRMNGNSNEKNCGKDLCSFCGICSSASLHCLFETHHADYNRQSWLETLYAVVTVVVQVRFVCIFQAVSETERAS